MKQYERLFWRIKAWLHEYFRIDMDNLRTASPVVVRRLYRNFGYISVALPLNKQEKKFLAGIPDKGLTPSLIEKARSSKDPLRTMQAFYNSKTYKAFQDVHAYCNLCDFYLKAIPCPIVNRLNDGSTVCEKNKYVIIKTQKNG